MGSAHYLAPTLTLFSLYYNFKLHLCQEKLSTSGNRLVIDREDVSEKEKWRDGRIGEKSSNYWNDRLFPISSFSPFLYLNLTLMI